MNGDDPPPFCTYDEIKKLACIKGACIKIFFDEGLANVYCRCLEGWTGERCELADIPIDYYTGSLLWIGFIPLAFLLVASIGLAVYFVIYKFCPTAKCREKKKKKLENETSAKESNQILTMEEQRPISALPVADQYAADTSSPIFGTSIYRTISRLKFIDDEDDDDPLTPHPSTPNQQTYYVAKEATNNFKLYNGTQATPFNKSLPLNPDRSRPSENDGSSILSDEVFIDSSPNQYRTLSDIKLESLRHKSRHSRSNVTNL